MNDDIEKVGLPKEVPESQVLSRFAQDPSASELYDQLPNLYRRGMKVYRKDKNLLSLIESGKESKKQFPLIDKTTRLVFSLPAVSHVETMAALYFMTKSKELGRKVTKADFEFSEDLAADNYIQEGHGYYFTMADTVGSYDRWHMVYGADYKLDRIDQGVFATYRTEGQMVGIPRAVREALDNDPEMQKAMREAEERVARHQRGEEEEK